MVLKQPKTKFMMKKITILFVVLLSFSTGLFAQDYIYLLDQGQSRIAAKNVKLGKSEIKYENYDTNDGRVYLLNPAQVKLIAYENGDIQYLQAIETKTKQKEEYAFKKNLVTFHLFDLVFSNFTFSYERILNNGKIGFQIPFSFGYGSGNNVPSNDFVVNKFYSGLNVNFYPTGQGKVRYVLGPSLRLGIGHDNNHSDGNYDTENPDTFYTKLMVNNGVMFSPIPELSLSVILSLGMRYYPEAGQYNEEVTTSAAFSFNLSYRF